MVTELPSMSTPAPSERSMPAVMSTSPSRGALVTMLGVLASRAATISLVTAFFDPVMRTSPRRGPIGSIRQVVSGRGRWRPVGLGRRPGGLWVACLTRAAGGRTCGQSWHRIGVLPVGEGPAARRGGPRPRGRGSDDTTCRRRVVRVRAR